MQLFAYKSYRKFITSVEKIMKRIFLTKIVKKLDKIFAKSGAAREYLFTLG